MKNIVTGSIYVRFFTVILLTIVPSVLISQEPESCAEKLRAAQANFSRGQVDQVSDLLAGCLRSGFKKEEELAAYKLLIQTYLLEDKIDEADSAMLIFLKKNSEYVISPTDHSSFVNLFNKFEVKRVLQLSLRAGTSFPFLTFKDENPTAGEPGKSVFKKDLTNLYLSAEVRFRITEKIEAGIEAGYSQLQFTNQMDFMDIGEISYTEYQKRLEIPITATYDITSFAKFTPYARAGIGIALNLSTMADAEFIGDIDANDVTGPTMNRKDSRQGIDAFLQAGGGIKYKIPKGYFFAEIRTCLGFLDQNVPGGETVDLLLHTYKWRDPGFRLNTLNFNAGWTYIFYKPAKRKI